MSSLFSLEKQSSIGQHFSDLGYEVLATLALKLMTSLSSLCGSDVLPATFVREAYSLARRKLPRDIGNVTLDMFCSTFLPRTCASVKLLTGESTWWDGCKFNALPPELSTVDIALRGILTQCDWKVVIFACALARRALNECTHLEYVLTKYENLRSSTNRNSDADSFKRVFENMFTKGVKVDRLEQAYVDAVCELGVGPRTGYRCPPPPTT